MVEFPWIMWFVWCAFIHTYIHKYGLNIQYVPNANLNAVEASGRPTWLSPHDSHLFKFFEAKTVDYPYLYGSEPRINRCLANPRFTSGSLLVDLCWSLAQNTLRPGNTWWNWPFRPFQPHQRVVHGRGSANLIPSDDMFSRFWNLIHIAWFYLKGKIDAGSFPKLFLKCQPLVAGDPVVYDDPSQSRL